MIGHLWNTLCFVLRGNTDWLLIDAGLENFCFRLGEGLALLSGHDVELA
jgi:hypothetical protein